MKTQFKLCILASLFLLTVAPGAANNFKVVIEENQIIIELDNNTTASTLYFKDKNGEILYREHLSPFLKYRKNLSLEVIPNGTYYLNMDFENKILTTEILKSKTGIQIQGRNSRITFKPCFKVDGKMVFVFLTNSEKMNSQLNVYDSNGILMESLATGTKDLRKTLDFSHVPPGEYLIKVRWGPHYYDKKVKIS